MIKSITHFTFLVLLATFFFSCLNKPNQLPVWRVSKPNQPTSYLVGASNYLTKERFEAITPKKAFQVFDSASVYMPLTNARTTDILKIRNIVGVGNKKTLKDTLSKKDFETIRNRVTRQNLLDVTRLKLIYFVLDEIETTENSYFNTGNFWLKRSLPLKKKLSGLRSRQGYFLDLPKISDKQITSFLKKEPIKGYSSSIIKQYDEVPNELTMNFKMKEDFLFQSEKDKKNYLLNSYDHWESNINIQLSNTSCFILLDLKYLSGDHRFQDYLLSKGYQVTRIE